MSLILIKNLSTLQKKCTNCQWVGRRLKNKRKYKKSSQSLSGQRWRSRLYQQLQIWSIVSLLRIGSITPSKVSICWKETLRTITSRVKTERVSVRISLWLLRRWRRSTMRSKRWRHQKRKKEKKYSFSIFLSRELLNCRPTLLKKARRTGTHSVTKTLQNSFDLSERWEVVCVTNILRRTWLVQSKRIFLVWSLLVIRFQLHWILCW